MRHMVTYPETVEFLAKHCDLGPEDMDCEDMTLVKEVHCFAEFKELFEVRTDVFIHDIRAAIRRQLGAMGEVLK